MTGVNELRPLSSSAVDNLELDVGEVLAGEGDLHAVALLVCLRTGPEKRDKFMNKLKACVWEALARPRVCMGTPVPCSLRASSQVPAEKGTP
jgi:hypothetical protein